MIIRRTFEAKKHPKGSPERARFNLSARTSEYYSSMPYLSTVTGGTYRTKSDAESAEARWQGPRAEGA